MNPVPSTNRIPVRDGRSHQDAQGERAGEVDRECPEREIAGQPRRHRRVDPESRHGAQRTEQARRRPTTAHLPMPPPPRDQDAGDSDRHPGADARHGIADREADMAPRGRTRRSRSGTSKMSSARRRTRFQQRSASSWSARSARPARQQPAKDERPGEVHDEGRPRPLPARRGRARQAGPRQRTRSRRQP